MSPEILILLLSSPFHEKYMPSVAEYIKLPWLASSSFIFQFLKNVEFPSRSLLFLSVRVNPHGRAGTMVGGYRPAVAVVSYNSEV